MSFLKSLTKNISLTDGNIKKNIFLFAIPIFFSGLLQLFYNLADQLVCANFGYTNISASASYTAITSTVTVTSLFVSIMMGFAIGANVIISNALGANEGEKGNKIIFSSFILSLAVGFILLIFCYFMTPTFLTWLGNSSTTFELAKDYLQIYFLALPFMMLFNVNAALLRGMGDSKSQFYFLGVSSILNIGLNFLFVLAFKMGEIKGVAWGTFISEGVSALLTTIALVRNKTFAHLSFKSFQVDGKLILEIVKVGLPASIQGSLFSIPNMIMQSYINDLGDSIVAGVGAAYQLESFLNVSQDCFGQACIAFVAANYGAKNIKYLKISIIYSLGYACVASIVVGILFLTIKRPLLMLFCSKLEGEELKQALEAGSLRMNIDYSSYILFALTNCIPYAIRGMKHSTITMLISVFGICGSRIIFLLFLYPLQMFHTLTWLFLVFPLSWLLTAVAQLIYLIYVSRKTFKEFQTVKSFE